MKLFAFLGTLIFSFTSSASDVDGWAWGVGFGTKTNVEGMISLDVKSPKLFGGDTDSGALFVSIGSYQTTYIEPGKTKHAAMGPARLMVDFRRTIYKEVVSGYTRIGVGYTFADQYIQQEKGFFTIPVQFGLDVVVAESSSGTLSTFFVQVGIDALAFNIKTNTPADHLNGNEVFLGLRTYY